MSPSCCLSVRGSLARDTPRSRCCALRSWRTARHTGMQHDLTQIQPSQAFDRSPVLPICCGFVSLL
ncbi:hypothetical protein BD413DRAFT_552039 [Trametes elegans]|nr:hypothetical protein BD413DRAFT_552039 [Trametes elegans]